MAIAYAIYYLQQSKCRKRVLTLLATLNSKNSILIFIYPTVSTEDKTKPKALIS
jgi:hypothetical protein